MRQSQDYKLGGGGGVGWGTEMVSKEGHLSVSTGLGKSHLCYDKCLEKFGNCGKIED
jgi:hypothetical protein